MLVRVVDIGPVDIANIRFDFDLVFAVVFLNQHGNVVSRYGSRTPWSDSSRVSLEGLKYTMRMVLQSRSEERPEKVQPQHPQLRAQDLPGGRRCMHCHQVWEGLRRAARAEGTFDPQSLYVYPRPENLGLVLDVTRGNVVKRVASGSVAARAELRAGDKLERMAATQIRSQADVSWALHRAPATGELRVEFQRDNTLRQVNVALPPGWRKTKLSWRASMRQEQVPDGDSD